MEHFRNGFTDIIQRLMAAFFLEGRNHLRLPALGQLLQRGHIDIAIVHIRFQLRHVLHQKAAILMNAVTAQR